MLETPTQKETRHGTNSTALVFVSLYFLLLAFFIYLNSISVPAEERIREVIGSIDVAFKGQDTKTRPVDATKAQGRDLGLARFHAEIRQVYEAAIPLIESEVNEEGDQLLFRIPISQLFAEGSATYRDNRQELFDEAARVLIKRGGVEPTDMEILYDAEASLPTSDQLRGSLAIKRTSGLVKAFVDNGVPKRNIFIGMAEQGKGQVLFKFYVRSSFDNLFVREATQ